MTISNPTNAVIFQSPYGAPKFIAAFSARFAILTDEGTVLFDVVPGDMVDASQGDQATAELITTVASDVLPLGTSNVTGVQRYAEDAVRGPGFEIPDPAEPVQQLGKGARQVVPATAVPGAYMTAGPVTVQDPQNPVRFALSALQLTNSQGENAPIPDGPLARVQGRYIAVPEPGVKPAIL